MRASTAPSLQNGSSKKYLSLLTGRVNLKIFCYKDTLKIYTFVHDKSSVSSACFLGYGQFHEIVSFLF